MSTALWGSKLLQLSACYWDGDFSKGIGTNNTSYNVTKIGSDGWSDAVIAMNGWIDQYNWQFVQDSSDGLPYLTNGL